MEDDRGDAEQPEEKDDQEVTEDRSDENDEEETAKYTFVLDMVNSDGRSNSWIRHIKQVVQDDLTARGILIKIERQSRNAKPKQPCARSRSRTRANNDVLDNSILVKHLVEANLKGAEGTIKIPFFLKSSCDFIRQHLDIEGIFRKSGAMTRKQRIVDDLHEGKSFTASDFSPSVHDVCAALTHILRSLETPLIPYEIHELFLSCLQMEPKAQKVYCLLNAVCLLPIRNIPVLAYFIQFLQEVAQHSSKNLMVASNLSVVMLQNIMPTLRDEENGPSCRSAITTPSISKDKISQHCCVIETLIEYADRVGFLSSKLQRIVQNTPLSQLDAVTSDDEDDERGSPTKRSRRSGSLNRLLDSVGSMLKRKTKTSKIITVVDGLDSQMKTPSFVPIHTPIIKSTSRKFQSGSGQNITSATRSQTRKQIMEAVKRNGLSRPMSNMTPVVPFPSAKITACLEVETSPDVSSGDPKQTPFGPKRKNIMASNLVKNRLRTSPESTETPLGTGKTKTTLADTNSVAKISLVQLEESPRKPKHTSLKTGKDKDKERVGKSPLGRSFSLRSSPCTTPSCGTLRRSPSTRCTLRRGRPNTVSVGLTRPSPTNNVLKIETSPPGTGTMLVRSSSSTSSFKKETYLYSSGATQRQKITMDRCSGRVSGRNSGGRPTIPESLIPKPQTQVQVSTDTKIDVKIINEPDPDTCDQPDTNAKPCMISFRSEPNRKSPNKETTGKPVTRSMSLRDTGRSYIPRPIVSSSSSSRSNISFNKKTPVKNDTVLQEVKEEEFTPTCPLKSASTSAIKTPLKRRNSVQELVQLFESSTLPKNHLKIPGNHSENQRIKPYTRTLERKNVTPLNNYIHQMKSTKLGCAWTFNDLTQKQP